MQAPDVEHDIQKGKMAGKTSRTSKASMTQQGPQCDRPETKLNGVMGPGEARG